MKKSPIEHITTMAELGEAITALVKESGVLAKPRGRKPAKRRNKVKKDKPSKAERKAAKKAKKADKKAVASDE